MTIIAVDFDGTLVEHQYPAIGPDVPGAFETLRQVQEAGAHLILWTMRDGDHLAAAVELCQDRGLVLWGINRNPEQQWTTSPKV
jgi:hydroxymethylpyrimidine pyrophosphatase-like HAD family hydrolase